MTQEMITPADPSAADIAGTPRATRRPDTVRAPAHWTNDGGPPQPEAMAFKPQSPKEGMPDPVRYGDWELKGVAIDF